MGLHTGEPSVLEEGYHGIGLHRGARIVSVAHGGQVLLSSATAELIQDDLPAGVTLRDLGRQPLKDIDRPEHLYQLVADGLQAQFPPPRTARKSRRRPTDRGCSGRCSRARRRRGGDPRDSRRLGPGYHLGRPDLGGRGRDPESWDRPVTGQVPVGASPNAVAACDGSIWTTNGDADSVSRVDPVRR